MTKPRNKNVTMSELKKSPVASEWDREYALTRTTPPNPKVRVELAKRVGEVSDALWKLEHIFPGELMNLVVRYQADPSDQPSIEKKLLGWPSDVPTGIWWKIHEAHDAFQQVRDVMDDVANLLDQERITRKAILKIHTFSTDDFLPPEEFAALPIEMRTPAEADKEEEG
jgi:hypothetical protein